MPQIEAAGATLVAISPQRQEHLRATAKQNGLSFDVLSDQGNAVAQQFGLAFPLAEDVRPIYLELFKIDLSRFNGDDSWTLPMPARFIIDQRSIIRAAEVNPDYTARPEPSETVAALRAMQTGTVKS